MRPVVHRTVPRLDAPKVPVLDEARQDAARSGDAYRTFLARIPAFQAIEQEPPARPIPWPGTLRIAAFNAERMKDRPAVRRLMTLAGAHIALFSEVDLGMARSGNAHNIRDLTAGTGEGYLYGVEFVELDLGDPQEMRAHAGERNACSLHGNAIVSALALEAPHLIPLDENGLWFSGFDGAQRRIGGRMALAARVSGAPAPLWIVGTHLESKTAPADRRAQIHALLRALETIAPNEPCVIGGDFNTKALPRGEDERHLLLEAPERDEPLFADLKEAGFAWQHANLALPTQTPGPTGKHEPPFGKLDWLVVRGLTATNPLLVPALDEQGRAVSDHEMITVDVSFP
ncbi:endonuclease/exonuclease/phosphatase family protein [Microvirga mediterraneensis]|uniref:Endonuclease/exonuclease/phosphatase family protein n=1 Tax=Microvirga mediterraneensis TaxID=2754695 RepID=A0A838BSP8_9HYPH|nr:endonuclease/exonuclease/phosphatase family protein [Microvirga mediterraneensis]MBA1158069.1 endonuclease/exonuclease/phosphatase family protein [Microvirga mediterraneensis]